MFHNSDRITRYFLVVSISIMVALTVGNILSGIVYDTDHFADTFFLLGAGWRVAQGLVPVIDFGHFYGGVMANGIGLTMLSLGSDVFAFDRFSLILLAILSLVTTAILFRRISLNGLMALILTISVLMLSRYPLELDEPITRIVSTHSFLYNRLGFALLVISGLFVALRSEDDLHDLLPGALVGMLVVLAALTKPTFIILAPGVILGLAVQSRWKALAALLLGVGISVAIFDPFLQRWIGSFEYVNAHVGDGASAELGALLQKAIQLPLSQPVATTFALLALGALIITKTQLTSLLGLLVVAGAGIGMATTMGGNGSLGQLALPVAILITLASGEIATRAKLEYAASMNMAAYGLVVALALPHMLNLTGAILEGISRSDRLLISQGPYDRYLSIPEEKDDRSTPTQYEMLADGVAALHALGEPSNWGIIADRGLTFEHAVLGRPVPGYPLWQRASAPELAEGKPIAPEADIVMIGRTGETSEIGAILRAKFGKDFALCTTSAHWEIHVRTSSGVSCPTD